ncbi:ATP cone domain-containing protein [Clostridium paraputrificum]|uniref:ATP cone domain-containing protein n=1 Tax=Clostridium paraputrificum TaxID=29363 RepID=UPI003D3260F0
MNIIKKDGRIQEFDKGKIFTSIDNASRDVDGIVLNESDIKILVEDIVKTIGDLREDGSPSSSYEIIGIMIEILKRDGFDSIAKSFVEYK